MNYGRKFRLRWPPTFGKDGRGKQEETLKEGHPAFEKVYNLIVGNNLLAMRAAKKAAQALGYRTLLLSSLVEGETREVAKVHAAIAKEVLLSGNPIPPPACILSGGETTVTLKGRERGGETKSLPWPRPWRSPDGKRSLC